MSTEQNVIPFPGRDYEYWLSWVECELSILGFDFFEQGYNWKDAFDRGLRPEEAAAEAAKALESAAQSR